MAQRHPQRLWDRLKVTIALCAMALTALGFWLDRGHLLEFARSADFLYLPALYGDLIRHAFPAHGWWLTPAPYFVPDMPLFFGAMAITPTVSAAYVLYAQLSVVCILGAFYWIGGLANRSRADRLLVVALIGLLFFDLARPPDGTYWFTSKWLLVPTAHGGAVIMGLLLLGVASRLMLRPRAAMAHGPAHGARAADAAGEAASHQAGAVTTGRRPGWRSAFWGYAGFTALAFAAVLSDRSVLYLFVAPLLAAGMVLVAFRRVRWWRPLLLSALVLAAMKGADALVGLTRKRGWFVIPDFQSEHMPTIEWVRVSWQQFRMDAARMAVFRPTSPVVVLLAASLLTPVMMLASRWWRRAGGGDAKTGWNDADESAAADCETAGKTTDKTPDPAAGAFALLALAGPTSYLLALAVPIVMGLWADPSCVRYALSGIVLPLLVLGAAALRVLLRIPGRVAVAAAAVAFAVGTVAWLPVLAAPRSGATAGLAAGGPAAPAGGLDPFYTPEIAFVDDVVRRHHLHNGFGSYWTAKPITLFSKTGTTVVVLHDDVEPPSPSFWIANPNWWVQQRNRPKGLGPVTAADYPIFDFVLCPSLNRQWVEAHFGPPAAVESGPGGEVLIYNRPSDVLFRNAGRAPAAREAGVPQEARVVQPGVLSRPKDPGAPWNTRGSVRIPAGGALTVRLAKPIPADFLRIQADNNDTYELEFRLGAKTVGTASAGPVPGMGLIGRDINLVPATGGRAFDTIIIRGSGGDGVYSVGHLAVFTDPVLHPSKPAVHPSKKR